MNIKCPKCGGAASVVWGNGWDWDREMCMERGCDYDKELDTMTYFDNDMKVIGVTHKEDEDEDET